MLLSFFTQYPGRWILCGITVLILLLWGLATDSKSPGGERRDFSIDLTVQVWPQGKGSATTPQRSRELFCDFRKTRPGPDLQGCEAVQSLRVKDFRLSSATETCDLVKGEPAIAEVSGTLRGKPVQGTFKRTNSCEVERWDRFGALLGNPVMDRR